MSLNKNIIGLTGKYCSGKSSIETILKNKYNYLSIDVDKIGHHVLKEKREEIIKVFGNSILTNNDLDRKKIGKIVFNNKKKLQILNSITHPQIINEVKSQIDSAKNKNICINAALLYKMKLYKFCNKIIIVQAGLCNIIKRSKIRDNRNISETLKILFYQKGINRLKRIRHHADICYIENNKNLQYLEKQINLMLE